MRQWQHALLSPPHTRALPKSSQALRLTACACHHVGRGGERLRKQCSNKNHNRTSKQHIKRAQASGPQHNRRREDGKMEAARRRGRHAHVLLDIATTREGCDQRGMHCDIGQGLVRVEDDDAAQDPATRDIHRPVRVHAAAAVQEPGHPHEVARDGVEQQQVQQHPLRADVPELLRSPAAQARAPLGSKSSPAWRTRTRSRLMQT